MPTLRPEDLIIGSLGQDFLGRAKGLVTGANAITKGDAIVVDSLSFDSSPQATPRAGTFVRSDNTPTGLVMLASNSVAVGRQVTAVDWLPLQFDTSLAAKGDPVYIDTDGSPTLVVKTVVIGSVVTVGTVAAGGAIILKSPGVIA